MAHTFEIAVRWKEGLRGEVQPNGASVTVPFSVPKEFGGPGGEWTPEHFFASGVASCVMATFLSIAQMSKLAITSYQSRGSCSMEKAEGGGFKITGVTLEPRITVPAEKDVERAQRLIEKAEKMCPISNSLKCPVAVKATVEARG
jgi:peroxiredoxin-like protein